MFAQTDSDAPACSSDCDRYASSYRHYPRRNRGKAVYPIEDLLEQVTWHGHFSQLERDVPSGGRLGSHLVGRLP